MASVSLPPPDSLCSLMRQAVDKVFSTMLQTPVSFDRSSGGAEAAALGGANPLYQLGASDPLVVGSIGFTGTVNGLVYFYMEHEIAATLAEQMTGTHPSELGEEGFELVRDVVGEVANMSVGSFKNELCDLGLSCMMTLPTVIRGKALEIKSFPSVERSLYYFAVKNRPFVVDLLIKAESTAA